LKPLLSLFLLFAISVFFLPRKMGKVRNYARKLN